jgi:regulator of cell morphogenesis and NO signaling
MDSIKDLTLAEIVTQYPSTAHVFEQHHLDFCCGGKRSLHDTCAEKGVELTVIEQELRKEIGHPRTEENTVDGATQDLSSLVDLILTRHHAYVKKMMPTIHAHGEKVLMVHGKNHPELAEVLACFSKLKNEMTMHMMKEESVLFPFIKRLSDTHEKILPGLGTVKHPIAMMEAEHAQAGQWLEEIRKATKDYSAPADACITYKLYYSELQDFEKDLHQHVHLENNILFPKAVALEQAAMNNEILLTESN